MFSSDAWLVLTDITLVVACATAIAFGFVALKQWITRKSFLKIDRPLRWTLLPLALLALTYLFFEKIFVVDTRPFTSGRPWESSFPSTHVMFVATIFFLVMILLPYYLKSRRRRLFLDALMFLAIILVSVGRILGGMHWPTDVLGALLFSGVFAIIYILILRRPQYAQTIQPSKPQIPKNHPKNSKPHSEPKSSPEIIQPKLKKS